MQYITNEQGERTGGVLDLETYQRLTCNQTPETSELLLNLSLDELEALANSALAADDQPYLDSLLAKNEDKFQPNIVYGTRGQKLCSLS